MQRSALGVLAVGLAALSIPACGPSMASNRLSPLPEPILATRSPPALVKAKPRPLRHVPPPRGRSASASTPSSWTPPGGTRKNLWKTIVLHHSASPKSTPLSMDRYHHERGWKNGLGYHFVIGNGVNYADGQVFVGHRWKRQMHGAHCKTGAGRYCGRWHRSGYFNDHGIGICLIGNFETGRPTAKQLASLKKLLAFLCNQTGIGPDEIRGHGAITHRTACPGKHLDMRSIRQSARAALRH